MDGDFFPGIVAGLFFGILFSAFLPNTAVKAGDYEWAVGKCAANGGIVHLRGEGAIQSLSVVCQNGAKFSRSANEGVTNG